MVKNIIKDKTFNFSLKIIQLSKNLNLKKEYIISKQIFRSGTSIGALVREADYAESKADFIHKIGISQKEANETKYWLELLYKSDYIDEKTFLSLKNDINQIKKILAAISISSRKNRNL